MFAENEDTRGAELFYYRVASGDMRFIENNERAIFFIRDAQLGWVVRGEVPGCGPDCHANLSQLFLEYVMGCEDCREAGRTAEAADRFGSQLGRKFLAAYREEKGVETGVEALAGATAIVLNSMDVPFEVEKSSHTCRFSLAHCPLHATAAKAALNLWVALAHRALVALLDTLLQELAPGWTRQLPAERETDAPLQEIVFSRK